MQGPNNNIDGTFPEAMNHFWCSALNPHGCSYCKNTDTKMKVFNKRTQKEVIRPIRSILTPGGTIPLSSYPSPYIPTIILSHTCHSTTRLIFSPLTYNKRQFTIVNLPGNTPLGCGKSPEVTETCILQTESTSVKIKPGSVHQRLQHRSSVTQSFGDCSCWFHDLFQSCTTFPLNQRGCGVPLKVQISSYTDATPSKV